MECQTSDSKKLLKVFDASKRKRVRKKREALDDTNSLGTDDSRSLIQTDGKCKSAKASLQDLSIAHKDGSSPGGRTPKRESSPSASRSPGAHRGHRSPRHRRPHRDDLSLALHAGLISTPRSVSTTLEGDGIPDTAPFDQGSCIYAFLEEAIKMDKKRNKHRRSDERRDSHNRDHCRERDQDRDRNCDRDRDRVRDRDRECENNTSPVREHRHHHRRRRDDIPSRDHEKPAKAQTQKQPIDQAMLLETFAKLCTTINEKSLPAAPCTINEVTRSQSHKSLQCEVARRDTLEDERPVRLCSREPSHDHVAPGYARVRSHENLHDTRARLRSPVRADRRYSPDKMPKYTSKIDVTLSRARVVDDDRYFPPYPTKSSMDHERREYYERRDTRRSYEDDKRRCEQKTSRSFDVHREPYDDERFRRTTRSDSHNKKRYDEPREKRYEERDPRDRRYDERRDRYYEERERDRHVSNLTSKERRSRRNLERFERISVASREEEYNRDRYSERERDSGMSVADGETSTVSGRSNYLKVVKQGIAEQRDAMEKMMKLWKELMRCFKTLAPTPTQQPNENKDSAAHMQESAEAQLRLWRECMRRYETVARDVGDTDARLMDEISKQRSEMAEMASMWQECLQRYRDMSNDFNSLKRQIVTESPTRMPAQPQPQPQPPPPPPVCAEGEGSVQPAPYRLPQTYPPPPAMPPMAAYPGGGGSPLRTRASAPPWWWMQEPPPPPPPRRHSSPESRGSRSHDRRHHRDRHKERDESRYNKEKSSSKPSAARSEHRRRKR